MTRITFLLLLVLAGCFDPPAPASSAQLQTVAAKDYDTLHAEALAYCRGNGFCEDYYFLADLSKHSGRNRFYVYDFGKKEVVERNLVTHGSCDVEDYNDTKYEKARFSNNDGSHCSSLGKYRIGKRDRSGWGIGVKYWLHGLEPTNSNAQARVVVLHSWGAVQDTEIYPEYSPLSWGCPAVSDNFMRKLDARLQATQEPVLLWIVD